MTAERVAIAGGMYHIMPAGVFQPASVAPAACAHDFDLWRNIALFAGMVTANEEGTVVTVQRAGRAVRDVPFTEERVEQLVCGEPIAPAAAACLELAWQHRSAVLHQ